MSVVSKTSIVKKSDSYRLLTISDTETRDDEKITSFPKAPFSFFWVNRPSQNLTGKKRGVLVEK